MASRILVIDDDPDPLKVVRGSLTEAGFEDELFAKEARHEIGDCLEAVPDRQRMAFVLREIEGLSTQEICKILEVSTTNMGVMLFRARNRLRECLESKWEHT